MPINPTARPEATPPPTVDPPLPARVGIARVAILLPALLTLLVLQGCLLSTSRAVATSLEVDPGAWIAVQLAALVGVAVLVWRVVLVARYRSVPSVPLEQLPSVTVIVPAYNEGQQVFETLRSLSRSEYPRDRIHIIAVDDGSVDDTWSWIRRGADALGDLVTPIRCRTNRGKRHALFEGLVRSRTDVVVTVDSDSEVLPDTLRSLVTPFVVDPRVGAVAGNVRVLNEDAGPLAQMLDLSFTYAFEFIRASESEVDAVQCCPGALSAYRRALLDQVRDEWLAQTFFGRPANIGEDRALTNLALREGYIVKFQANAIVRTEVPGRIPQLSRMLLRWARSNVRESIVLGTFVFTRFREGGKTGARINFLWSASRLLLGGVGLLVTLGALIVHPSLFGWLLCMALLSALMPASVYGSARGLRGALWAFPWALMSATVLAWIGPYGLVTAHRSGWLTRQLPTRPPTAPVPVLEKP